MKSFKIFIVFIMIISSCTKEIEIDMPEHESKAVLYCLFRQGDNFKFHINSSVGIFDDYETPITNAHIYLKKDGANIDTLTFNDGMYKSDVIVEPSKKYSIHSITPGLGEQYATSNIYEKPIITAINTINANETDEEIIYDKELKITIKETPNEENFYEVYLGVKYFNTSTEQNVLDYLYNFKTRDPVILNEGILPYYPKAYVFSDELFNDESVEISIFYQRDAINLVFDLNEGEEYAYVVVLRSISKDYYTYQKILNQHLYNQDSDVWDGLSEPTQMYSNIEGGYGIFAGYSEIHYEFFTGIKN